MRTSPRRTSAVRSASGLLLRRANFSIIYADLRFNYKVATQPSALPSLPTCNRAGNLRPSFIRNVNYFYFWEQQFLHPH
jgi:hypothetical protein